MLYIFTFAFIQVELYPCREIIRDSLCLTGRLPNVNLTASRNNIVLMWKIRTTPSFLLPLPLSPLPPPSSSSSLFSYFFSSFTYFILARTIETIRSITSWYQCNISITIYSILYSRGCPIFSYVCKYSKIFFRNLENYFYLFIIYQKVLKFKI